MKNFTFSFKSLLIAAWLMLGSASAWGTDAFVQNFTDKSSTNPSDYGFTVTVQGTQETGMSATVTDGKLVLVSGGNSNSRGYYAKATFSPVSVQNEITFSCTWAIGEATGNNNSDGTAGSYSLLSLGDGTHTALELKYAGQDKYLMVNGVKVKNSVNRNQTWNVSATLNMNTKKITALSIGTEYSISESLNFYSSDATSITTFTFTHMARAGSWKNTSSIDNVSITYEEKLDPVESFVVNYKYNDVNIASENFDVDGLKIGNNYTVPFRMYVSKDGALYKTSNNTSGDYYRDNITLSLNTVVNKTLSSVDLGGGTLVLLEDLDNTTAENADTRASYGSCYNNTGYTSAVTLSPGIYKFIVKAQNKGRGSSIKVGETTVCGIADINATKGTWTDKAFNGVEIYESGNVTLVKGSGKTIDCYDIIIAIRTGDVTVPATITEAGYATFSSAYPLDLANLPDGLTAFRVSGKSGDNITMEPITTTVAANTGLVLKGAEGDYNIPVAASGTTYNNSSDPKNYLFAMVEGGTINKAGEGTNYVLGLQGGNVVFAPIGDNSATVAAGRAGLWLPAGIAGTKALRIVDGGITEVTTPAIVDTEEPEVLYNMAGQIVGKDYKGIVISNKGIKRYQK